MLPNDVPPLCDLRGTETCHPPRARSAGTLTRSPPHKARPHAGRAALPGRRNANRPLRFRGLGRCAPGLRPARPGAQRPGRGCGGRRARGARRALAASAPGAPGRAARSQLRPQFPKPPTPTAAAGPPPPRFPPGHVAPQAGRALLPAPPRLLLPGKWREAARSPCPPRGGSPRAPGPGALFAEWSWRGDSER